MISDIARNDLLGQGICHVDIAAPIERDLALSVVAIAKNKESRTVFTSPAIDDDLTSLVEEKEVSAYVAGVDVLLLDGHQMKSATQIARQARVAGVVVILDGDLYRPGIEALLPLVDIAIFGKSFVVPNRADKREIFEFLGSFGINYVIATDGPKPIEFVCAGVLGRIEVEQVSVVDTLAAGDVFHGAFCYSYSINHDVLQALKFAARVASRSVTRFGTRDWMREFKPSSFE